MPPKNVLVAQSGGPSAVINNSLRGVVEACFDYPETFGTIYAGYHGIEGVLKEELLDLSAQSRDEISLLRNTPGAGAIGTCRYKIKSHMQEDFDRVVDVPEDSRVMRAVWREGQPVGKVGRRSRLRRAFAEVGHAAMSG